jgi:hypothetical protein
VHPFTGLLESIIVPSHLHIPGRLLCKRVEYHIPVDIVTLRGSVEANTDGAVSFDWWHKSFRLRFYPRLSKLPYVNLG